MTGPLVTLIGLLAGSLAFAQSTVVTLHWKSIPQANLYVLKVDRGSGSTTSPPIYKVDTIETQSETPELAPGTYTYTVEGYRGGKRVGRLAPQVFVVGSPVALATHQHLPAPKIIEPKPETMYPVYGTVRAAWTPVAGARAYRFRLWNPDSEKLQKPPRWVTEVDHPWIVIRDAPYTSYMYLDSGLYHWDVAALDRQGAVVGDGTSGSFEMSRQYFLKTRETVVRVEYALLPGGTYSSASSVSSQSFSSSSVTNKLAAEGDWWLARQWGVGATGDLGFFSIHTPSGNTSATLNDYGFSVNGLYRLSLSNQAAGWVFVGGLGFGMREIPLVDQFLDGTAPISSENPVALGPRFSFRFEKRFENSSWGMQFGGAWLVNTFLANGPADFQTGTPNDGELFLRFLYNWKPTFALSAGVTGYDQHILFTAEPAGTRSSAAVSGVGLTLGVQFR